MLNLTSHKSIETDFCLEIKQLDLKLDIVNKNVLYITHECDKILKIVRSLENSCNLQKQVDEYFDDEPSTSPQTDSEDKRDLD